MDVDKVRIRYGTDSMEGTSGYSHEFDEGFDHEVSAKFTHPEYVEKGRTLSIDQAADHGLLILKVPIEHRHFVLQLPEPNEDKAFIDSHKRVTVLGGGLSFRGEAELILKEASIRLYRKGTCLADLYSRIQENRSRFRACAIGEDGGYRICPGIVSTHLASVEFVRKVSSLFPLR